MAYKIAFFGAKPYDIASFDKVNEKYNYDIRYYKGHLNPNNVVLTQDTDEMCIRDRYEYYEYDVVYGDVLIIDSYYRWLFYSSG